MKENSFILTILSCRCLGAVQVVMLSGQKDAYRSGV